MTFFSKKTRHKTFKHLAENITKIISCIRWLSCKKSSPQIYFLLEETAWFLFSTKVSYSIFLTEKISNDIFLALKHQTTFFRHEKKITGNSSNQLKPSQWLNENHHKLTTNITKHPSCWLSIIFKPAQEWRHRQLIISASTDKNLRIQVQKTQAWANFYNKDNNFI